MRIRLKNRSGDRPNGTEPGNRPVKMLVAVIVAFIFLGLDTDPTVPSVPVDRPAPPALEHVEALQEIEGWLVGSPAAGRRPAARERKDLVHVIRENPKSFELFRRHVDPGVERDFVRDLPYGAEIEATADRHGLDGLLLAALVEVESRFLPDVISPVGAVGLTQVMPSTARWMGAGDDLTDPDLNLDVGAAYLARMLERFEGDIPLALAAYNAGPAAVARYGNIPPYRETRDYVRKVLRIYARHNREVWRISAEDELFALQAGA